jgi:hypothetical protein
MVLCLPSNLDNRNLGDERHIIMHMQHNTEEQRYMQSVLLIPLLPL